MNNKMLVTTKSEMAGRGWNELDIILITGDAYVDHPSYGTAIIGRVLEKEGYKVGIISQPGLRTLDDIKSLGRPKLFFGITAGNLDSMVANYTANKKFRGEDEYSPGGKPGKRPDRAIITYTNKVRQAYDKIPIVIGGIEASMRRLAHFDYWSETVRRSILIDSKADILVYGMGERQITEIARRISDGHNIKSLEDIPGTVIIKNSIHEIKNSIELPSYEEALSSKDKFNEVFRLFYLEQDPYTGKILIQRHGERFIVQNPPSKPLNTDEIDRIYELPYSRKYHPSYNASGGVPGFATTKFSIISHRGCPGQCSFCSLYAHQGRIVQSRSIDSILKEIKLITSLPDFKGTISDIGGPSANLYEARCQYWEGSETCKKKRCLVPKKCENLKLGYKKSIELWEKAIKIPGVKHIFAGSGIRYDLLNDKEGDEYLKNLCAYHISGQLKIAPEHCQEHILDLMNKPRFDNYEKFLEKFYNLNKRLNKKQYLVNYFIVGHPGTTLDDALALALKLRKLNINPEQIQDFLPLPMTLSGTIFYTEKDPFTLKHIYVPKNPRERKLQRALIQHKNIQNKRYIIEALRNLGKMHLMKIFYK